MKATKILLSLVVMGTLTLGFADANTPAPTGIDAQITAIQTAKPEDRVALMNQFKTQLSTMNAEERSAAISQMQAKMQGHMQDHGSDTNHQEGGMGNEGMSEKAKQMGAMGQNKMQEHAGEMQSNMNEGMNRMQNMNQQQAGNHYGQEMQRGGAQMEHGGLMSGQTGSMDKQGMQNMGQDYMKRDH